MSLPMPTPSIGYQTSAKDFSDNGKLDSSYTEKDYLNDVRGINPNVSDLEKWATDNPITSAWAYDNYMSNTAYQRAVKDLKKAGLNPWLALNSGASNGSASAIAAPNQAVANRVAQAQVNSNNAKTFATTAATVLTILGFLLSKTITRV